MTDTPSPPVVTTDWYASDCAPACSERHTYRWGDCVLASEPEPERSLSILRVRELGDGQPGIVTEVLTLDELAARIEAALRTVPSRLGPNALVLLERGETVGLSGGEYAGLALAAAMELINDTRTEGDDRA